MKTISKLQLAEHVYNLTADLADSFGYPAENNPEWRVIPTTKKNYLGDAVAHAMQHPRCRPHQVWAVSRGYPANQKDAEAQYKQVHPAGQLISRVSCHVGKFISNLVELAPDDYDDDIPVEKPKARKTAKPKPKKVEEEQAELPLTTD